METNHIAGAEAAGDKAVSQEAMDKVVPPYAMIFFDHLYSEYLTLKSRFEEPAARDLMEEIYQRRLNHKLTWSNIYTFDLTLVDERPPENLIRKAYDARNRYRSVAGQKEFDEYQASKPPDLTAIRIAPDDVPPQPEVIIELALRADIKYVLGKIYLYYALLPLREDLREQLTQRARKMTYVFVGIVALLVMFNVGGLILSTKIQNSFADFTVVFGLTVATVALAGVIGGCVSMLQRIQSAPSEGDALFNLASLTNGWVGLSLSPLYGAIFASLLFVLFAAGILKGTIFPQINTPGSTTKVLVVPKETPAGPTSTNAGATGNQNAPAAETPSQTTTTTTKVAESEIVSISDFLQHTGPSNGIAYALLIIWSFIAGFAERLVPDTLNRMVAKNEKIQGTNT